MTRTRKLLYLFATVVFCLACAVQPAPVRANRPLMSMSDDYYMRHRITPFALRAEMRRPQYPEVWR